MDESLPINKTKSSHGDLFEVGWWLWNK